jgi:ELKS/RAB6-interacting/CAST family protein 1
VPETLVCSYFQNYASNIRKLESQIQSQNDNHDGITKEDYESLKLTYEGQTKEVKILRKSVDEMVLRLETQKQTLTARDESIKKLLEMMQNKGVVVDRIEESQRELEKCRVEKVEDSLKLEELKRNIGRMEKDLDQLKEVGES